MDLARVLFFTGQKDAGLSTLGWIVAFAGWILAVTFLIVFVYMTRRADKVHKRELDRVCAERTKLQEKLTDQTAAHSKRRKPN